jgi:hypothetical protein
MGDLVQLSKSLPLNMSCVYRVETSQCSEQTNMAEKEKENLSIVDIPSIYYHHKYPQENCVVIDGANFVSLDKS